MQGEAKRNLILQGLAAAMTFLPDDAIDSVLDEIERAAIRTGGWIQFSVMALCKMVRIVLDVPDDDIDQMDPK